MPLFLAGLASLTFGIADFAGAVAARRAHTVTVVLGSHVVAFALVLAAAPLFGGGAPPAADLGWGVLGGVAGSIGLAVFYHALATTRVGVAAPMASVVGTLVPVVFGIAVGERPEALAWVGMVLALPAMVFLPATSSADPHGRAGHRAALLGAVAGLGFGLFGIFISRTGASSGLWPLASARVGSLVLMVILAGTMRVPRLPTDRAQWVPATTAGVLDITANVFFLLAVREELLSLVAVIMAFYPASTILLARLVFGERTVARQAVGLGFAAAAVTLIVLA